MVLQNLSSYFDDVSHLFLLSTQENSCLYSQVANIPQVLMNQLTVTINLNYLSGSHFSGLALFNEKKANTKNTYTHISFFNIILAVTGEIQEVHQYLCNINSVRFKVYCK